jgi:hypothetical protein
LAGPAHVDDDRVITAGILRQKCSNIAERSFRDLSPLRWSRFHTVCMTFARRAGCRLSGGLRARRATGISWQKRERVTKRNGSARSLTSGVKVCLWRLRGARSRVWRMLAKTYRSKNYG